MAIFWAMEAKLNFKLNLYCCTYARNRITLLIIVNPHYTFLGGLKHLLQNFHFITRIKLIRYIKQFNHPIFCLIYNSFMIDGFFSGINKYFVWFYFIKSFIGSFNLNLLIKGISKKAYCFENLVLLLNLFIYNIF